MVEPNVRFKQEDGSNYPEWEILSIDNVCDLFDERSEKENEYPVLSSTMSGIYLQSEYFNQEVITKTNKGYRIVPFGYITYRSMSDTNVFRFNVQNIVDKGIVSPAYPVFTAKPEKISNAFLTYQMNNSQFFFSQLVQAKEGGTRYALAYNKLSGLRVFVPCIEEQQKITGFLFSVDEIIAASEQEVANLETQKKAAMKKIFSQEVRFKRADGTDFPEWEEKLLSDVSQCLDNQRIPINATERATIKGNIPYYGAGNIQGYINKFLFDEDLVLLLEDGDAFDDFRTKSISQFVSGKCWINNHAHVLRPLENPYFLHCVLSHKDIRQWTQLAGQSRKKLTQENMMRITLEMPCLEEQCLIANFLSNFDEAISAAKKELELWKELKKGLLQQMFV